MPGTMPRWQQTYLHAREHGSPWLRRVVRRRARCIRLCCQSWTCASRGSVIAAFPKIAEREVWQRKSIIVGDVQIDAFGALSEIRGIASRGIRPTKIILDDAESSHRMRRKDHRDATLAWYDEVIENLGDNFTHIEIVGTLLHPQSLLAILLERPGFEASLYKSIISESKAVALWTEYVSIYRNRNEKNTHLLAHAFYKEHKAAMDVGVEVLWPQKESYERLVQMRARIGSEAFEKEKQNAPTDGESRIFYTSAWRYFNVDETRGVVMLEPHPAHQYDEPEHALADMQFYGYLDSAVANRNSTRKGDFAAIVVLGRLPGNLLFIMDAVVERIGADEQVCKVYELFDKYQFVKFGYENNSFQELVGSSIEKFGQQRREKNKSWQIPLRPVTNFKSKRERVESLQSRIGGHWVFFNRFLPKILFEQADEFPHGKHDDALDALAGVVEMAFRPLDISHVKTIARNSGNGIRLILK